MPFALRLDRRTLGTYATQDEALAAARRVVQENADHQPEVLDTDTGEPVAPAASAGDRDLLARKIGY
jgi:hypothetical protein